MCLPFNKQVDFGTQANPTKKEHLILSKKIYIKDLQKDIYFFLSQEYLKDIKSPFPVKFCMLFS